MNQKTLWQSLSSLSPEARQQVVDFIAFLETRYATAAPRPRKAIKFAPLKQEDFIGMWRQREDLQDSTPWVRKTRATAEKNWTLESLLSDVTSDCLHTETDTGTAVGREVW